MFWQRTFQSRKDGLSGYRRIVGSWILSKNRSHSRYYPVTLNGIFSVGKPRLAISSELASAESQLALVAARAAAIKAMLQFESGTTSSAQAGWLSSQIDELERSIPESERSGRHPATTATVQRRPARLTSGVFMGRSEVKTLLAVARSAAAPQSYPLLVTQDGLKDYLLEHGLLLPTYWLSVLKRTVPDTLETRLTRELVVLPVDGRYNETVMDKITGLVAGFLSGVRSRRIVSAPSRRHEYR